MGLNIANHYTIIAKFMSLKCIFFKKKEVNGFFLRKIRFTGFH